MPEGWWTIDAADGLPRPLRRGRRLVRAGGDAAPAPAAQPRGRGARLADRDRRALARAGRRTPGSATAAITLEPYSEIESELRPEIASGRRGAEFAIAVRNVANAPVDVAVAALDNEGACRFDFDKPQLSAPPGRRDGTPFRVRPPKQMIFGRTKERRFTVTAQVVGSEAAARPQPAVFRQRPWIPAWVLPIVPILIAAGVAVWALRPNNTTVPDLTGAKLFAAQQKLSDAGLKLGPQQTQETGNGAARHDPRHDPGRRQEDRQGQGGDRADRRRHRQGHRAQGGRPDVPGGRQPPAQQGPAGRPRTSRSSTIPSKAIVAQPDARPGREGAPRAAASTSPSTRPPRRPRRPETTTSTGATGTDTTGSAPRRRAAGLDRRRPRRPPSMPALAGLAAGAAINALGSGVKTTQQPVYSNTVAGGQGRERRSAGGQRSSRPARR